MRLPAAIDRSLKALIREFPVAFFRLAGVKVEGTRIHTADVSVNLPEFRADDVLVVQDEGGASRFAVQLEYQLEPDGRLLQGWFLKNAGLTRQLRLPVFLVTIYLRRGRRRRFPDAYRIAEGRLENEYRFQVIRLWEHAARIRSGELGELAPRSSCAKINRRSKLCWRNGN